MYIFLHIYLLFFVFVLCTQNVYGFVRCMHINCFVVVVVFVKKIRIQIINNNICTPLNTFNIGLRIIMLNFVQLEHAQTVLVAMWAHISLRTLCCCVVTSLLDTPTTRHYWERPLLDTPLSCRLQADTIGEA